MIIKFTCFLSDKKIFQFISDSEKIFILQDENSNILLTENPPGENKKEIANIKREKNIYILESKSQDIYVNRIKAELVQIETGDVIEFLNFTISINIYILNFKKALIEAEHPNKQKIIYHINDVITFIGNEQKAHIPAYEKNPLTPVSEYSAAILLKNESYELIPINTAVVKFRMKELKIPIKLENGTSFQIGSSNFIFRFQN